MNVGIKCKLDRLEEMFLEVDYIPGQQPPSYEELEKEFLRIKRELIQDVLSFKKEPQLQRYVRYHQQAMVKLMDQVLELGTPAVRFKKLQYEMCYERLDELLEFVQYNFSEYFDWDAYVPQAYLQKMQVENKQKIDFIANLCAKRNIDKHLASCMLGIMNCLLPDGENTTTYWVINYVDNLQKEIRLVSSKTENNADMTEALRNLLIQLNVNNRCTWEYFDNYLQNTLCSISTPRLKYEWLSLTLKKLKQLPCANDQPFDKKQQGVSDFLIIYLDAERSYWQKFLGINEIGEQATTIPNDFKIKLELSVAQLACLLKALVDNKIIRNTNVMGLLRFFSGHTITKKTEKISLDSLRGKYYNIEWNTRQAVADMLEAITKKLNDHDK